MMEKLDLTFFASGLLSHFTNSCPRAAILLFHSEQLLYCEMHASEKSALRQISATRGRMLNWSSTFITVRHSRASLSKKKKNGYERRGNGWGTEELVVS
jgi:hypothetical protein